jgi:hypothetical protein
MQSIRPWTMPSAWVTPLEERRQRKAWQMAWGVPLEYQIDPEQDPWPPTRCWAVQPRVPTEYLDVKATLGIPAEVPTWEVYVFNPSGWHGYCFDLFGTLATADDPLQAPRFWLYQYAFDTYGIPIPGDPPKPPGDVLAILDLGLRDKDVLIAWHRRLIYQHGLPRVEVQWHPETGLTEPLYYIEGCTQDAVEAILRGRRLLRHLTSTGRPVGTYALTQDEFLQMFQKSKQRLQQQGEKITQEKVAAEMHLSDVQLRRYFRCFGLSWSSLKNKQ